MSVLSNRALQMLEKRDFLDHYAILCLHDPYDSESNKQGYVNLGTSVSSLCEDVVLKRLNEPGLFDFNSKDQHYFPMWGIPECRQEIAKFLTRHLTPDKPLHSDNVLVLNGGVAAMEVLACCLFNPGEVLLTPSPCYTRIFTNFNERFHVHVEDVLLRENSIGDGISFELRAELLEATIKEQISLGRTVKGFFLVNPNNPLGEVYSPDLVMELISVCQRYGLHFIADEAYAMCIYESSKTFRSILNLQSSVVDPNKIHVIWAFSKDVNLAGLRMGVLISWNKDFLQIVKNTSMYTAVPSIVQRASARLLSDTAWIEEVFLPVHRLRLQNAAKFARQTLNSCGIEVRPAEAGFFLWVNLKPLMPSPTRDEELFLFKHFMEHKIYITPGSEMKCADPGWFRIVFTAKPEILHEGLRRISAAILSLKNKNASN